VTVIASPACPVHRKWWSTGLKSIKLKLAWSNGKDQFVRSVVLFFVMANLVGGCENMTTGQRGAMTGAALGSGIGMVAGGSFGQVVSAGLIGGAAGYVTGSAVGTR
jgi:hypothetical protein